MAINDRSHVWQGVYRSFAEVPADENVFRQGVWRDKLTARVQAQLADSAPGRSIPRVTTTADYALPFVAATVARRDAALRILDFGGGAGTSYLPLRAMLPADQALDYVVIDNEDVCRLGRETLGDRTELRFCSELPSGEAFDLVHAGSALHYVEDWRGVIDAFAATGASYLLFADVPAGDIETFVTAQWFHGRRIPVHFWNVTEFCAAIARLGYELVLKAAYAGYYLERGGALPTAHFDAQHRLDQFCQLVFRRSTLGR